MIRWFADDFARNYKKNYTWNIRHLVNESFVSANQQTRVSYCILSDYMLDWLHYKPSLAVEDIWFYLYLQFIPHINCCEKCVDLRLPSTNKTVLNHGYFSIVTSEKRETFWFNVDLSCKRRRRDNVNFCSYFAGRCHHGMI